MIYRVTSALRFYFCTEQNIKYSDGNELERFKIRRILIAYFLAPLIIHIIWWSYMISHHRLDLFLQHSDGKFRGPLWILSVITIVGSLIGGASSEGGGAVAFPVLSLGLGVSPYTARDFTFMIQSVGMSAAAFSIFYSGIRIEWRSLIYCTVGGMIGLLFSLQYIVPFFSESFCKIYFVCIWFAFALILYWFNLTTNDNVYTEIPQWEKGEIYRKTFYRFPTNSNFFSQIFPESWQNQQWDEISLVINTKAIALICIGFLGGFFSAISGAGLDICSFAMLTLLFRVSERVATPTSVVLMAANSLIAFAFRASVPTRPLIIYPGQQAGSLDPIETLAWELWLVTIPIACLGAPFGAYLASFFHRHVFIYLVIILDTVQLIAAFVIIQPWTSKETNQPSVLCGTAALMFVLSFGFFYFIAHLGYRFAPTINEDHENVVCSLSSSSSSNEFEMSLKVSDRSNSTEDDNSPGSQQNILHLIA
jgi:uncharacterized membrane protein YfcA